jgi:hypothetical protein
MAIGINSKVKFRDGDPPDVGVVLNIATSSALSASGFYVGSQDPNEVFASVRFPRFPDVQGWHRISSLSEVSD